MNRIGTICLLAVAGALNAAALEARPSPYDKIAERNLFQLRPPTVVTAELPPPPPRRKIHLTGIATILARPVAFITIDGTKAQAAEFVMLWEGQSLNGVEVSGIDKRAGVVRIVNDGESQLLNFEIAQSSGQAPVVTAIPIPAPAPPAVQPQPTMTPEEQAALIELQRIKFKKEGNPTQAILPPAEVTDQDSATP